MDATQNEPSAAHVEVELRKDPEEEIEQAQEGVVLSKVNAVTNVDHGNSELTKPENYS